MLTFTSSKAGPCPAPNRGKKKRRFFVEIHEGMCAQQPATMTVVGPQVMRVLSSLFFFFLHFFFFFFSLLLDFFFFILNQVEERPFFFMSISGCHQGGRSLGPLTIGPSLMDHFEGLRKHFFFYFYGWNTLRTTRSAWSILLPYLGLSHDRSDQRKWLWVIHEGR